MPPVIRPAVAADLSGIKALAVDAGLFAADEVEMFDEMFAGYLDGSLEGHAWLVASDEGATLSGAAYYAPEPFSDRMWNLYFLAVTPGSQGSGCGKALTRHVETTLRDLGSEVARTLIVETSSLKQFAPAREFYGALGYEEEARIREFYGPGDDKVVFWKLLDAEAADDSASRS